MRRIERSTAFKRDYRKVKAMTRYRDLDERLVAVLELWSATARCPPAIATTPYREIGRATGTVISGPTSC